MKDHLEILLRAWEAGRLRGRFNTSGIFSVSHETRFLDPAQLARLEAEFRRWAESPGREDIRLSRKRILLIFLLIRYTGARLGEVLTLDVLRHLDLEALHISLGTDKASSRQVPIPSDLGLELRRVLNESKPSGPNRAFFQLDPGHVRRKFYDRAEACGLPKDLGNPTALRRSRAIELLRNNVPLPLVQKILGHSTANLTASYLDFSAQDMQRVVRHFMEKESRRRTSARNTFFGRVTRIHTGDIQSEVELTTLGAARITAVITNESLERLKLDLNVFVSAEIKAPWVIVAPGPQEPRTSAGNRFRGVTDRILRGAVTTEIVVLLEDGTELCSLVTEQSRVRLGIREGDTVWVMFNDFAPILNAD